MSVERTADRLYTVTTESGAYDVDLRTGACTCPDASNRAIAQQLDVDENTVG
jgi:hypothetical protein